MSEKKVSRIESAQRELLESYLDGIRGYYGEVPDNQRVLFLSRLEEHVSSLSDASYTSRRRTQGAEVRKEKLQKIREKVGLTQAGLARKLRFPNPDSLGKGVITNLEAGNLSLDSKRSKHKKSISKYLAWVREQGYDPIEGTD